MLVPVKAIPESAYEIASRTAASATASTSNPTLRFMTRLAHSAASFTLLVYALALYFIKPMLATKGARRLQYWSHLRNTLVRISVSLLKTRTAPIDTHRISRGTQTDTTAASSLDDETLVPLTSKLRALSGSLSKRDRTPLEISPALRDARSLYYNSEASYIQQDSRLQFSAKSLVKSEIRSLKGLVLGISRN